MRIFTSLLFVILCFSPQYALSEGHGFQTLFETSTLPPAKIKHGKLRVASLGTTSLLISDGVTQILIDGFVTRRNWLREGVSPDKEAVLNVIEAFKLVKNGSRTQFKNTCNSKLGRGLSLIIPTHGHYDHALDAGLWAAWSSACLVADASILAVYNATKTKFGTQDRRFDWSRISPISPFEADELTREIRMGRFQITLLRSHHLNYPFHWIVNGTTNPKLSFPTSKLRMKIGTNLAVHIKHGNKSLLIIPSSGKLFEDIDPKEYQADVVFLGIGAIGTKSKRHSEKVWQNVVKETCAKRVFPVHWDDDRHYTEIGEQFTPSFFGRFRSPLKTVKQLAQVSGTQISMAPAQQYFDPFENLNVNNRSCH